MHVTTIIENCKTMLLHAWSSYIELWEWSVNTSHVTTAHEICKTMLFDACSSYSQLLKWSVSIKHVTTTHENCQCQTGMFHACMKWSVNIKHVTTTHDDCMTMLFDPGSSYIELWKWSVNIIHATTTHGKCKTMLFRACSSSSSYESDQSTLNMLQLLMKTVWQCYLMHVGAISSYENG